MLKIIIIIAATTFISLHSHGQRESFRIFGVKIKAKEIVGQRNFNEMGLKYYTKVIAGLTEDSSTYLWRLGSFRLNFEDYTDGTMDLFNLSNANHTGGYLLLDSIDFTYYREWGFQILEHRYPAITSETHYWEFKDSISNPTYPLNKRRELLWNDRFNEWRSKLLMTRFFVNSQVVNLNKNVVRKIKANIAANFKTSINDLLQIASGAIDTVKREKADSARLALFFTRSLDRTLDLKGHYITAGFQIEYLNKLSSIISEISRTDKIADPKEDEFTKNLSEYLFGTDSSYYATNSALFAFRFTGSLDRKMQSKDSMALTLSALFNIGSKQAASLAAAAEFVFSRQLTETFRNEFSKIWIVKFGSDQKFEILRFKTSPQKGIPNRPKKKEN